MFRQKNHKKYYPHFFIFLFLSIPISIFIWSLDERFIELRETIGIIIALEVGFCATMKKEIERWFFMPIFKIMLKETFTRTTEGECQKWYSISIENCGFSSARNVRIKIRDAKEKTWVNLTLPFLKSSGLSGEDSICIKNLSIGEDRDFNIGFIGKNNKFQLSLNVYPNNQKFNLNEKEKQIYFLEIVADNVSPNPFKVKIENEGYGKVTLSCFN